MAGTSPLACYWRAFARLADDLSHRFAANVFAQLLHSFCFVLMSIDHAVELSRAAVMLTLKLGAPILVMAVAVGLIISVMQAVTQLQDQTLSFVPKIVAMLLTLLYILPWAISEMMEYTSELVMSIPGNL